MTADGRDGGGAGSPGVRVDGTPVRVGTAGWRIPKELRDDFPDRDDRTQLWGYARRLNAVEINKTFYRLPMASTFARWRDRVPDPFRFALKAPREITHGRRLEDVGEPLDEFLGRAAELGDRLGVLLFQLPPSLGFDEEVATSFLRALRDRHRGSAVVEPRHESWFREAPDDLLRSHDVGRVAANPPRAEADGRPGGDPATAYFRLHGTPETYRSAYRGGDLDPWERRVREAAEQAREVWCSFDNTAEGEGTPDALELVRRLVGSD